jgi:hypothetical protein
MAELEAQGMILTGSYHQQAGPYTADTIFQTHLVCFSRRSEACAKGYVYVKAVRSCGIRPLPLGVVTSAGSLQFEIPKSVT